jgi:hypothetical protein
MKQYKVYALIKSNKPVYIGMTTDIVRRAKQHKKTKIFSKIIVIKSFDDKEKALVAENAIITFLTLFGDGNWYNAENVAISAKRLYVLNKDVNHG